MKTWEKRTGNYRAETYTWNVLFMISWEGWKRHFSQISTAMIYLHDTNYLKKNLRKVFRSLQIVSGFSEVSGLGSLSCTTKVWLTFRMNVWAGNLAQVMAAAPRLSTTVLNISKNILELIIHSRFKCHCNSHNSNSSSVFKFIKSSQKSFKTLKFDEHPLWTMLLFQILINFSNGF